MRGSHIDSLQSEIKSLRSKIHFYELYSYELEKALEQNSAAKELSSHIHDLIFLCHPDKHGDSQKATSVTAWLLDVRRGLRQ